MCASVTKTKTNAHSCPVPISPSILIFDLTFDLILYICIYIHLDLILYIHRPFNLCLHNEHPLQLEARSAAVERKHGSADHNLPHRYNGVGCRHPQGQPSHVQQDRGPLVKPRPGRHVPSR